MRVQVAYLSTSSFDSAAVVARVSYALESMCEQWQLLGFNFMGMDCAQCLRNVKPLAAFTSARA